MHFLLHCLSETIEDKAMEKERESKVGMFKGREGQMESNRESIDK